MEEYKEKDPLEVVKKTILEGKIATQKEIDAIDEKVDAQVAESVRFSEESDYPDPSEAMHDVYAQPDYPFITD